MYSIFLKLKFSLYNDLSKPNNKTNSKSPVLTEIKFIAGTLRYTFEQKNIIVHERPWASARKFIPPLTLVYTINVIVKNNYLIHITFCGISTSLCFRLFF